MTPTFKLTDRQRQANKILAGPARNVLLRGGSRSGKTFLLTRAVAIRAIRAPNSRHAIFRFRFNHIKTSIIQDTWPKMMRLCFPGLPYHLNKSDWLVEMHNGSQIVFAGLDDKDRTEKILGQEYATVYYNECSQIPYDSRNKAMTRLAQNAGLTLRALYDCNPPQKGHWTHSLFEQKIEPRSRASLSDPDNYVSFLMNPSDNAANLPAEYITILESLPEKEKRRFLHGLYGDQVDNALWTWELIDRHRIADDQLPDFQRIVVAVDPSGCSGPEDTRSDEVGIVVAGVTHDQKGVVLEDDSGRYSPTEWAKRALKLLDKWMADTIVAETNFGGAMVEAVIQASRPGAPVKVVTASRGKAARAEPVSALYELGRVKHLNSHPELEEQLVNFSTAGYQGARSPDRADAMVWALSELMVNPDTGAPWHNYERLAG